jgi:hypothetical protein
MDEQVQPVRIETAAVTASPPPQHVPLQQPNPAQELAQLVRFLYNHNPFYIISALLVFSGLWQSFSREPALVEAGIIALGLAAYTLLLALTAWLIICLGHVWEDARSILLVVVLMFLAISVSLDPVLNAEEQHGVSFVLAGFLFAVLVSEGVLRSLPLRLPALFRIPYYLVLGLFFLYPLAMSPLLDHPPDASLYWALFGFSAAAGVVFLTLIPAIRRGPTYVDANGSPWRWPLYPWVMFGMLGLCVCLRAYYLCVSFHPILGTECIFGPYFLVPFLIAVNVLLVEAAVHGHSVLARRSALVMPGVLLLLAMCNRAEPVYATFLNRFVDAMHAGPLYLTLLAAIGIYGYALIRRLRGAGMGLAIAVALLSFVTPYSMDLDSVPYQRAWPLIAVGGVQVAIGCERRDSRRVTLGAAFALAPLALGANLGWLTPHRGLVVFHLVTAVVLTVGALFHDEWARFLRIAGAGLLSCTMMAAVNVTPNDFPHLPALVVYLYPLLPITIGFAYAACWGGSLYYAVAAAGATMWPVAYGWQGYQQLRTLIVGLDMILWGVAFFLLAAMLSLIKAGVWSRVRSWRRASA